MMKIILSKTSFAFVYKNCFQTILSKSFVKNKNIRPENYKYKIEDFNPKQSKYSINKNIEIKPQGEVPKFLEKDEFIKKQIIEQDSEPKRGISLKGLKSGKRLVIIKKPFQRKMTKEQLKLNKEKLELETKIKEKQLTKEERLLLENKEHSLMRHEGSFIEKENMKYRKEIKEMRQKRIEDKSRIFNTESLANFEKEERLSKRLARLGVTSRRQAEKLIEKGMIKINGKTVTQNVAVTDSANIQVYSQMGYKTPISENTRVWLFYKPCGFICTKTDEKGRLSIFKFLEEKKFPVKHFSVAVKSLLIKGSSRSWIRRINCINE
jgi:hypothetical protein